MRTVEADYLVIGAGATGMAFTDALVADSDATVVMVDRRHAPGGHWNDAYPFVRLHQPSAVYGVNSVPLGRDQIDEAGLNAGFYEQATAAEICAYYQRTLEEQLLGSGQVTFFGSREYVGTDGSGHRLLSRVTGQETAVRARRVVDGTYLDTQIPSRHVPDFDVEPGARVVPPDGLVDLPEPGDGFTLLGAGKTAMDACTWLLDQGVPATDIRWVRPRDAWVLDRACTQPLDLVGRTLQDTAAAYEAAAEAEDLDDLYARAEACGHLYRLDPEVEPDMFHSATLSAAERKQLGTITRVIRKGRVRRIGVDELTLDEGSVPTTRQEVHVDCTARGLGWALPRPVFEDPWITPQPTRLGQLPFSAALIGFLETSERDEDEKNRLTRPNPIPRTRSRLDWAWTMYLGSVNQAAWGSEPDIQAWLQRSRLNISRALPQHLHDERVQAATARIGKYGRTVTTNLARLLQDDPVLAR
jgi:hypothetical protein